MHRCRKCHRLHHTLLHHEIKSDNLDLTASLMLTPLAIPPTVDPTKAVLTHVAQTGSKHRQLLLMTCRVSVSMAHGFTTHARALLDSASSNSFISERLAQHLHLPRSRLLAQVAGIRCVSHQSVAQVVVHFSVLSVWVADEVFEVDAIVLPKVTCDLPLHPVSLDSKWHHLSGIKLADSDFGV